MPTITTIQFVSPVPTGKELPWDDFKNQAAKLAEEKGIQLAGQDEFKACRSKHSLLDSIPEEVEVLVFIGTEFFRKDCFVMKNLYRGRNGWQEYCIVKDDRHLCDHIHAACF